MPIDPFAMPNPFGDPFGLGQVQAPSRVPAIPSLTPQEQEGLLSQIGSGALHGLGWIGGVMDKTFGGRAIRAGVGMLGGRNVPTSELLSFIPGSDTFGLTNPENSVSGAELLGGNKDTPFLSEQGLGGTALELALDPSLYLSFGGKALTSLGEKAIRAGIKVPGGAARAAGLAKGSAEAEKLARYISLGERAGPVSPKAIADVTGKSLGGHLGIGLPFGGNLATFDLTRPIQAAGSALEKIPGFNKAAEATAPLRRGFSALFDANVKGQIDPVLQDVARGVSEATPAALFESRGKMAKLSEDVQALSGWQQGMPWTPELEARSKELGKQLRTAIERTPSQLDEMTKHLIATADPAMIQRINQGGDLTGIAPELLDAVKRLNEFNSVTATHAPIMATIDPAVADLARRAREVFDEQQTLNQAAGFKSQPLKKTGVPGPEYGTRAGVQFEGGPKSGIRATQLSPEDVASREKLLANLFSEGPGSVNWLTGTAEGRAIQQLPQQDAAQQILEKMLGWDKTKVDEFVNLSNKSFASMSPADHVRYTELVKAIQPVPASAETDLFHIFSYKNPKDSVRDAINALQGGTMRPIDTWATDAAGSSAQKWSANAAQGTVSFVYDQPALQKSGVQLDPRQGITKINNPNAPKMDPALSAIAYKGPTNTPEYAALQQTVNDFNAKRQAFGLQPVNLVSDKDVLSTITPTHTNLQAGEFGVLQNKIANTLTEQEAGRLKQLQGVQEQARGLADWQKKLDLGALEQTGGFFGNHPLADMEKYLEGRAVNRLNAGAAYQAIPKLATTDAAGAIPVAKVMENLGLDLGKLDPAVQGLFLPKEQANALTNWIKPSVAPHGAQPWLNWIDSITNLTKAGQTSWPATQARNVLSDVFNRFAYGGSPVSPLMDAKTFREGGVIPNIAKRIGLEGMSDADATKQIAREMYQLGLMDTKKFQAMEAAGVNPLLETTSRNAPLIGVPPTPLSETLMRQLPNTADLSRINPLEVRGVGGRAESKFFPVAMAQSTQNYTEELNKMATYINARERGFEPLAARGEVIKAHLDFSNLTQFEKNTMRRIAPFYSWSRQSLPNIVAEISQNPGGRMAQTMRLLNAGTDNGFLPENVTQTGYAIPAGQDERGRQNYLTSLGLPFEDLANLTSLRNLLGSTNPIGRLPYELATGRQVFTGQNVPTTFPFEGDPVLNSIAMNSPLSRVFTTFRAAQRGLDSGQYWPTATQVLAGPRISSVDPLAARRSAVRELANERLGNLPEISRFENLHVRPGQASGLTPEQLQLLSLYNAVNRPTSR